MKDGAVSQDRVGDQAIQEPLELPLPLLDELCLKPPLQLLVRKWGDDHKRVLFG